MFPSSLLAMAKIALLNGYVRPTVNNENIHDIKNGRHPLLELISSNYQPNDYCSSDNVGKIKILTGPNASGKSVYLKQVALIIFLTHIGSFVPATKATIAKVHSIHSRIHTTESITVRLSSFMIDLSQMSSAIYNANASSFMTVDEFGRGTTGSEGLAILAGALKKFIDDEDCCPHILVSTHLQQLLSYLPKTRKIQALKMQHTICEEKLVFSYQVVEGVSKSYAMDMAKAVGLGDDIVNRARDILNCLQSGKPLTPLKKNTTSNENDNNVLEIPKSNDS